MDNRICSIDGCGQQAQTRGWCNKHYKRWRRNGTTERLRGGGNPRSPTHVICHVDGCTRLAVAKRLCLMHYKRWQRSGDPAKRTLAPAGTTYMRLLEVINDDPAECVFLPGSDGRPVEVTHEGQRSRAHRVALELTVGGPPEGSPFACHECGNGHLGCVTPRHLRWDNQVGNMADKALHGTDNRGEKHPLSRFTEDDIRLIRHLVDTEQATQAALARRYGVSAGAISSIVLRKRWTHVH